MTSPRSNRRLRAAVVALSACLALLATAARPARAATVPQVNDALKRAVKYLYTIQGADGSWEYLPRPDPAAGNADVRGKQGGGLTAMATYALLAAGERPQDARVAKAIDWLLTKSDPMIGHYAIGMRTQVWTFLPVNHPQRALIRKAVLRDRDMLLAGVHKNPKDRNFGFYPYYQKLANQYDRSVSQYGVLGMWAVEQALADVPREYWATQDKVWKKSQQADGGWNYHDGTGMSTPNMTAAGVATLFITADYLLDVTGPCKGNAYNQNLEMALAWMDRNVPGMLKGNYYGMYGVERIGVASGRKYFGKTDWYAVGSDFLVKAQAKDGAWGGEDGNHNAKKIPDTCFAIYFLTRGRAPVVMNKLQWKSVTSEGLESGWNQRHRDLANFTKWMGKNLDGRYVNWQVVTLKGNVEDLHDSPILYLAGSEALAFSKEDVAKLKQFVQEGGLIVGNVDCGKQQFAKGFKQLGKEILPGAEFRDLPANHVIFTGQQFNATKWKTKPKLEGLSNGVRELMILIPVADPAKAWQARADRNREELFQLGANLALYASGGSNLRYRGESHIVRDNGKPAPTRKIRVARVTHGGGNADPEPGGWRRLAIVMKNANIATLTDFDKPVELGTGKLAGHNVAHLTGTAAFTLTARSAGTEGFRHGRRHDRGRRGGLRGQGLRRRGQGRAHRDLRRRREEGSGGRRPAPGHPQGVRRAEARHVRVPHLRAEQSHRSVESAAPQGRRRQRADRHLPERGRPQRRPRRSQHRRHRRLRHRDGDRDHAKRPELRRRRHPGPRQHRPHDRPDHRPHEAPGGHAARPGGRDEVTPLTARQ